MEDSGCNSLLHGRGVGRLGFRICVPSYVRHTVLGSFQDVPKMRNPRQGIFGIFETGW